MSIIKDLVETSNIVLDAKISKRNKPKSKTLLKVSPIKIYNNAKIYPEKII
jgi:hypothetical protein